MSIFKYITIADFITVINALIGFLAIMYVIDKLYVNALILILFAIILDGLDGILARQFRSKHTFGVFLDAIADTVSFCFAPAVLLYSLFYIPTATSFTSWINFLTVLATFFVAGLGILRLARFIVIHKKTRYFVGLPTPALALFIVLLLLPLFGLTDSPEFVLPIVTLTSLLMISDIQYPKLKRNIALISGLLVMLVIISLFIKFDYYEFIQVGTLALSISYIYLIPFFFKGNRIVLDNQNLTK
jgi:CDP-diacylglycerol--serine O-phosphatidyltransferase